MSKHSPGPWTVSAGNEIRANSSLLLATMHPHLSINEIPQDTNAKLMAAAPELKASLSRLWHESTHYKYHPEGLKHLQAALDEASKLLERVDCTWREESTSFNANNRSEES